MMALRTVFFGVLLLVGVSNGQPPASKPATGPGERKNDPQDKIEPRMSPGVGQKYLARFAGEWTVDKEFYSRTPGAEPTKTKGTCVQEMIHDGRFLRSEFTFENAAGKSTGSGWIGFDPATGQFTSTWIDSRQTKMSFRQSREPFDGQQIVLHGVSFEGDKTGRKSRTVSKLENEGRTIVHTQYGVAADGSERIVMKMTLTKKERPTTR